MIYKLNINHTYRLIDRGWRHSEYMIDLFPNLLTGFKLLYVIDGEGFMDGLCFPFIKPSDKKYFEVVK